MPGVENVIENVKNALNELSSLLDDEDVKSALGQLPGTFKTPIIEGLKTVLGVLQDGLRELKDAVPDVETIEQLLGVVDKLLEASEGLVPGQKDTLETVRKIAQALQDLPTAEEIEEIIKKIDEIIGKLENL
jgi:hypothetical protein